MTYLYHKQSKRSVRNCGRDTPLLTYVKQEAYAFSYTKAL